ncbi:hypothetical protein U9M48_020674, partial [Paspalum notatum var. saurae]
MATTVHGHRAIKLFGRERTLHEALGGRRAADVVLWRDKKASACILAAATAAWFLFEVAEYHLLTLLCYAAMVGMLVFFLWTNASSFLDLPVPRIPETPLSERATRQAIHGVHSRVYRLVETLYDIACGKDIKMFILVRYSSLTSIYPSTIILFHSLPINIVFDGPRSPTHGRRRQTVVSLYIASVVADCFSSLTLLYLVVLVTMTVPALYEQYESEVDHLVARGVHDLRSQFADMDSGVLRKIPKGAGAAAPAP